MNYKIGDIIELNQSIFADGDFDSTGLKMIITSVMSEAYIGNPYGDGWDSVTGINFIIEQNWISKKINK